MLAYNVTDRIEWKSLFSHKYFQLMKSTNQIMKIDIFEKDEIKDHIDHNKENIPEIMEQSI